MPRPRLVALACLWTMGAAASAGNPDGAGGPADAGGPAGPGVWPAAAPKLIEFGLSSPSPAFLRDHHDEIAATPFDGVSVKLSPAAGGGFAFDPARWDAAGAGAARREDAATLAGLPPSELVKNSFLVVQGTSAVDWFDDAAWAAVEDRLRWCGRTAKAAGFAGVLWDPEPYNDNKHWRYPSPAGAGGRPFEEVYAQVRRRGARFLTALRDEFPGLTVLSLRQLSDFQTGSPYSQGLLPAADPAVAARGLAESYWGLHASFTNGILDGMAAGDAAGDPPVTFVDGNEEAYYYTSAAEFDRARTAIARHALALVDPARRDVYRRNVRVGHAVSTDYPAGRWAGGLGFPRHLEAQATVLTPRQRARWFEHNVYHALRSTDGWVWVYGEADWWEDRDIAPGFVDGLASAKRTIAAGDPLGFEVEEMLRDARDRLRAEDEGPGDD